METAFRVENNRHSWCGDFLTLSYFPKSLIPAQRTLGCEGQGSRKDFQAGSVVEMAVLLGTARTPAP